MACGSDPVPILEQSVESAENPENGYGTLIANAPDGEDFWTPPDPLPGQPGDVIWARHHGNIENGSVYLLLYRSESVCGQPRAVTAWVAIPDGEPPAKGRPILTYGHGTKGNADQCAPTKAGTYDTWQFSGLLAGLMGRGFVFIAPDYEGLGTPGPHPYAQAGMYGKNMLDAARAVQRFEPASAANEVVFMGFSAGGSALAKASEIADKYAPELKLLGGIGLAGAFVSSLGASDLIMRGPNRAAMILVAAGSETAYGAEIAPVSRLLTDFGADTLEAVEELCVGELLSYYRQFTPEELFRFPWDPAFTNGTNETGQINALGLAPGHIPLLVIHPAFDLWIDPSAIVEYASKVCSYGQEVAVRWQADIGHSYMLHADPGVRAEIFDWIDGRLSATKPPSDCGQIPPIPAAEIFPNPAAEIGCGAFESQSGAQRYFEHFQEYEDLPIPPEGRLDTNSDGIMCGEGDQDGLTLCGDGSLQLARFCAFNQAPDEVGDFYAPENQTAGGDFYAPENQTAGVPNGVLATCGSFLTPNDAQTWFDANPDFGENVDGNGDGTACGDGDYGGATDCEGRAPELVLPQFCDQYPPSSEDFYSPASTATAGVQDGTFATCGSFLTPNDAQTWFDANPDFGENVDGNGDGTACGDGDYGGATDCEGRAPELVLPQFCDQYPPNSEDS